MESKRITVWHTHESAEGPSTASEPRVAWEKFTIRWAFFVRSYLRRLRCTPQELDELAADVLADAYTSRCTEGEYLLAEDQIVRRAARDVSRQYQFLSRNSRREVPLEVADPPLGQNLQSAWRRESIWNRLRQLLEQLPPKQQFVIEGHMDGVPDRVLAARWGATPHTVRTMRYKGMRRLRDIAKSPLNEY